LISQIKQLHELIEKDLGEQQFERVIAHLTELEKLAKTEKYYIGYSTVMFYMNDIESAKRYIEEGLRQFSYSFSLHFNAVILSYIHGELENTFKHIGYSIKYSETTDQEEAVNKKLNEIYYELLSNNYEDNYLQELLNLAENIRVA